MKVSIAHADTCLSDYWRGDSRPHLQITAHPMTFAAVRRALESEVRQGAVMGSDDNARLLSADFVRPGEEKRADELTRKVYAAIRRDVKPAKRGNRLAFRDIDISEDDFSESVYAFFVIMVEE